jgi:transcriptional regulator with XRE-family HTH domain
MVLMYIGTFSPARLRNDHTPTKPRRNEQIRARHLSGEQVSQIAGVFGLSKQRVSQIARGRRQ